MNFICRTSWVYSGYKRYNAGEIYDLSQEMIHTFLAMKDSDPNNKIGAMKYFATAVGGDDDEDDDWEPPKNPDLIDGFQTIQIPKPLNPFPDISAYSGDK